MDVKCPRCQQTITGKNLDVIKQKARKHRCGKKALNNNKPATAKDPGLVAVPIGPFGLFGTKYVSARKFQRDERKRERREFRQKQRRSNRRKAKAKRAARQYLWGRKSKAKKKSNWIIPGLIKW